MVAGLRAVQWATLPFAALITAVLALNMIWGVGEITSAQTGLLSRSVPIGWPDLWAWMGLTLAIGLAEVVFQACKVVFKIAPTHRGLAIRASPIARRMIPWSDIQWRDPTHVEWIQLIGTGRATVTLERSQRIYRWFHPS